MKTISYILVALGMLTVPTLAIQKKFTFDTIKPNGLINTDIVGKIKAKTSQWKAYSPEKNPLFSLSDS
jgi:hypothetical protein